MARPPFEPNGAAGSGGNNGPEDVDAAFAEIVADLEREGVGAAVDGEQPPGEAPGGDTAGAGGDEPRSRAEPESAPTAEPATG